MAPRIHAPEILSAYTRQDIIMKTVATIQARLGSTRLPGKVLMNMGDRRIIESVFERVNESESTDSVWLAVGDEPENEA